ncbi:MAG TPA: hypothetical protein VGA73_15390 [Candidatus Binatia bacterium]
MLQRLNKLTDGLLKIGLAAGLLLAPGAGRIAPAFGAADGKPIGGIQCERQEYGDFHIHAHLDIFVDGKPYAVPPQVGIIPAEKCLYWMHTHDGSGIIHIEAPKKRAFTLAQFFSIWKATGEGAPARKEAPKVFVNGKMVNRPLDKIELGPLMEIVVVYGKEPASVPSSYEFPKG